jgi:hypothetical protein
VVARFVNTEEEVKTRDWDHREGRGKSRYGEMSMAIKLSQSVASLLSDIK